MKTHIYDDDDDTYIHPDTCDDSEVHIKGIYINLIFIYIILYTVTGHDDSEEQIISFESRITAFFSTQF